MKTYKVTVAFEILDEGGEVETEMLKHGKEEVEREIALGFSDPNFNNVQCKVEEKL